MKEQSQWHRIAVDLGTASLTPLPLEKKLYILPSKLDFFFTNFETCPTNNLCLLTQLNLPALPELDPSQVQAILETLPRASHPFDSQWPPERARMRGARSWDGQLNTSCHVYSEFLKATKGTSWAW